TTRRHPAAHGVDEGGAHDAGRARDARVSARRDQRRHRPGEARRCRPCARADGLTVADRTRETQYQAHVELRDSKGLSRLGLRANAAWHADPKRLGIVLSRYKFVAKMLSGKTRVLEVGCGDGWASRVVKQEVETLVGVDFDPVFVEDARGGM